MTVKTLPFDLERAQSGVAVCLADGTPVEIVNFSLGVSSSTYPILGRYKDRADEDVYEVWPASGTYADVIGGPENPPQDLCLVASKAQDLDPDETDYEAELDYQNQVNALRDDLAEARHTNAEYKKELAKMRENYAKATLNLKAMITPEVAKNLHSKIVELNQVVAKERRERERLEVWQKETLEVLKDWRQVENFVDAEDGRADGELGLEAWAVVLGRLKTLRDLTAMLKRYDVIK
jgi:hypothetical protein